MTATCGCGFGYEECDSALLWNEARVAASRKEHKCYECGDPIPAGARCCRASWIQSRGDKWMTAYRCVTCTVLAEYVAEQNEACPLWGGLSESCFEAGVDWFVYRTTGRFSLYLSDEEESA